jgi:hypothetical protein
MSFGNWILLPVQKTRIYSFEIAYYAQNPVLSQGQGAILDNLAACMRAKPCKVCYLHGSPGWLISSHGENHPWIALCIFIAPLNCAFVYEYGVLFIEFPLECSLDRCI